MNIFWILLLAMIVGLDGRTITIYNKCTFTVWPGIMGSGNPAGGGFKLESGKSRDIQVDNAWPFGRIWARTGCDEKFNCDTGFCGNNEQCNGTSGAPPVSLAEFVMNAWGGQDLYDVSLVYGYNLPVLINPRNGNGCKTAGGCVKDLNSVCPKALVVKGRNGTVVGCKSGCLGYDTDQECCRGAYGTPDKCSLTPTEQIFKDACPTAHSYIFDEGLSTFRCQTTADYTVQFC